MTIGKTVSRTQIAITALAPRPNISVKIGYSAMSGAEYSSHTSGSNASLSDPYQPIATPQVMPSTLASPKPTASSTKLALTCSKIRPDSLWSTSAHATFVGLATRNGSTRPS